MSLCCDVIKALKGRSLATAESCTGGGIGAALTAVPGSSAVYKGGVISYTNEIKHKLLGVKVETLVAFGAVSEAVAKEMAEGAKKALSSDFALSVTGLAGPGGDDYGNSVGTVFIGYADEQTAFAQKYLFSGDREAVRNSAIEAALKLLLRQIDK